MPDHQNPQIMRFDELVELTAPYYAQLEKQGELADNEIIQGKQLQTLQQPVVIGSKVVVQLRLKQEAYRAQWSFADQLLLDKWQRKDSLKAMKQTRKAVKRKRKAARKAERSVRIRAWFARLFRRRPVHASAMVAEKPKSGTPEQTMPIAVGVAAIPAVTVLVNSPTPLPTPPSGLSASIAPAVSVSPTLAAAPIPKTTVPVPAPAVNTSAPAASKKADSV